MRVLTDMIFRLNTCSQFTPWNVEQSAPDCIASSSPATSPVQKWVGRVSPQGAPPNHLRWVIRHALPGFQIRDGLDRAPQARSPSCRCSRARRRMWCYRAAPERLAACTAGQTRGGGGVYSYSMDTAEGLSAPAAKLCPVHGSPAQVL